MAALLLPGASPANAYSPGTATAKRPAYNVDGTEHFSCSFAGWRSGTRVNWTCELYSPLDGTVYTRRTGYWNAPPSSHTTSTFKWTTNLGEGAFCTRAHGLSVDGGDTDVTC
ncbi:hypothetical protein [Nocardioides endophyticus]|uniref:hypothetical protein n=1 Tax=Nocardioides endophyticus TaxID=1353775 RepID=UPI0031E82359